MRWLLSIISLAIFFVLGATIYLQPSDFLGCGETPVEGTSCDKADAIVVISGGNTKARTEAGVEMLKKGWADTIIFSGAARDKSGPSNAADMRRVAIENGVSLDQIIIDEEAETTQQNAEKSKLIFENRGFNDVILVTSGYHQRRASLEFNQRTSDVSVRDAPVHNDGDWGWWWWLTPRGWWLAGSEMTKIIAFYIGGVV